jgi:Tol biopolymer transport system component
VNGGEPELIRRNVVRAALTKDGSTLVFFERMDPTGSQRMRLMTASPPDADAVPLQSGFLSGNKPLEGWGGWIRFSPDGRKVLVWAFPGLYGTATQRADAFWVIDWPAKTFRPVFTPVAARTLGTVAFGWMPDSRHVVLSLGDPGTAAQHLWMGDTERDTLWPITSTPATENFPSVSPDGQRLAFTSEAVDFDLVALPLDGGPARTELATSRNEYDPGWSEKQQLVFVTDRSGTLELWVTSADGEFGRPLVTDDKFQNERTLALGAIAVSHDGTRVAYQRLGERSTYGVWMSQTSGAGDPVPVVDRPKVPVGDILSDAPSWSPKDDWLALRYLGKLVKLRVGSKADPVELSSDIQQFTRIDWAPDGHAIVYTSSEGLTVVPADGGAPRVISEESWFVYAWSPDSRRVIGVREANTAKHFMLVAIDPVTRRETILNRDLGIIPAANQPIRGLARKGKDAMITSIARARSDIWMLEGFAHVRGLFNLWR